jgi:PAS domain S-box-containing protein
MNDTRFNFELFFELSPDLLCIAGYDGYFKKINSAVSKTLGYTMEELYSRPINDFVFEDDKEITAQVRRELTKSKPLSNFENRYITKSGEIVWLYWTSLPVDSDQLIFAIAKNITHKKRMEAERNALLASLTEANKGLRQLSYTASHDLRSPVNNILSLFNMIDMERISDKETLELIGILKLAGEKLKQTVNKSVDALTAKHKAEAKVEDVPVNDCLNEVLQSIGWLIQTSRTTIHTDFARQNTIRFNKPFLESIFLNLITNSIKYAQPGIPPVIHIHTDRSDAVDQLVVADNGMGFDMEKVKSRIFGLQQNFHDHSDSKGLGLYLVFSHVTALGGNITVDSKPNEGTRFVISMRQ